MPKFYFQVRWDDHVLSFQEILGLDVEIVPMEYRSGNQSVFSHVPMQELHPSSYVTMRKGIMPTHMLTALNQQQLARKTVTIALLDEEGAPTVIWELQSAFVSKVTIDDYDTNADEVAVDTIEFTHEGFTVRRG
jgi:phage tail-like protein